MKDKTAKMIGAQPNVIAWIVIETRAEVANETIYRLLGEYFQVSPEDLKIREDDFVWIQRDGKPLLLAKIQNITDSVLGARHFGGKDGRGALQITLSRHDWS